MIPNDPGSSASAAGAPAACTIIARNYLSHARILAESYRRHEPGARVYVLVVDELPEGAEAGEGVIVLGPDELDLPQFYEMCFKYDPTELCTAVKPTLLARLMDRYGEASVIYFDPDILVARPLDELKAALETASIVLIPHLTDPIPDDKCRPNERDILISGAYNLGFIALRKSPETDRFLAWWTERLRDDCRVDVANGLFVDQRWVDLVPGLFASTTVLRDETYDVAYWNLHSRRLEKLGDQYLVNGRPLAFFHFSGFNPGKPKTLSKHQNRLKVVDGTGLAALLKDYALLHDQHGYADSSKWPYGYAHFDDGTSVNVVLRRLYLDLDEGTRQSFGNPFHVNGATSFLGWATMSQAEPANLSPFLLGLYRARPDLAAAFPNIRGRDRAAFLEWARKQGSRELGYPDRLVRADVTSAGTALEIPDLRTKGSAQRETKGARSESAAGVNVCGYLRNETGIGAVARGYVGALRAAGVPVALKDISHLSVYRSDDRTLAAFDEVHPHDVNLICVNADQHFVVKSQIGDAFYRDRYNIGVWFWELPSFPAEWHNRFLEYDEIWVASSFIINTLAPIAPIPIVRVPPVLTAGKGGSRERGRQRLRVGADEFVFLFVFDFRSYFDRKNPLATIAAFRAAFAPTDPVRLVIKCVNEDFDPSAYRELREQASGYPISIHAGYWSVAEMRDLMAAADAYVSLHRSEGAGLTIADAMALGKPVVATGWSGNMDFMNVSNSYPVRYDLVQLKEDVGPYRAGETWAEPSVVHAAELMRHVVDDRGDAARRGEAARLEIERDFSEARVGAIMRARLEVIAGARETRGQLAASVGGSSDSPDDGAATGRLAPLSPDSDTFAMRRRVPVLPPMDLNSSLFGPVGRLAKRAVSVLLSYHTYYQQTVNSMLARFASDLAANQDRLAQQLEQLEARLASQEAGLGAIHARLGPQEATVGAIEARLADQVSRAGAIETRLTDQQARLSEVDEQRLRLQSLTEEVATIGYRLGARPFMATDAYGANSDLRQPMGYDHNLADPAPATEMKHEFMDLFRGTESFIAERQRIYLPFFRGMKDVVDLGCGRGEFLGLLAEAGIPAIGIDRDDKLVERCQARGLRALHDDALEYLRGLPDGNLDGIFSAQFIEHLTNDQLSDLLTLARRKLRPGGVFIAETINPECVEALKTFHVDLTHQRPLFPQVVLFRCEQAGFPSAQIFYPLGGGFTQESYGKVGEYAVVAMN